MYVDTNLLPSASGMPAVFKTASLVSSILTASTN